jgi:hypothetical protein
LGLGVFFLTASTQPFDLADNTIPRRLHLIEDAVRIDAGASVSPETNEHELSGRTDAFTLS